MFEFMDIINENTPSAGKARALDHPRRSKLTISGLE